LYSNKETMTEEIKRPIGDFILENATGIQGQDGVYYHYSEVCKLLRLQEKELKKSKKDLVD
jgi:hypothetical protein